MTDVVVTEGLEFHDSETHTLANKFTSIGAAAESIDVGGSHYHISVESTADAADTPTGTRIVVAVETSSADANDTDSAVRGNDVSSDAAATEVVTGSKLTVATIIDSASASESTVAPVTAQVVDTADAADTLITSITMEISDTADASSTPTVQRQVVASVESTGAAVEDPTPIEAADIVDAGDASSTVIGTALVIAEEAATAEATESVVAGGSRVAIVADAAVASETVTPNLHATTSVSSEADGTETLRTSADVIKAFWNNTHTGAAALWTGLPFNSMVARNGRLYGAGPDGIFEIVKDANDDGDPINSEVLWDLDDFGSMQRKRPFAAYIDGSSYGPFTVRFTSEQGRYTYKSIHPGTRKATMHRADIGRGQDATRYRVGVLQNKPFDADRVVVEYESVGRRT